MVQCESERISDVSFVNVTDDRRLTEFHSDKKDIIRFIKACLQNFCLFKLNCSSCRGMVVYAFVEACMAMSI